MKRAISIAVVVALVVMIFCGPLAHPAKAFAASIAVIGAVIAVMAICGITLTAAGITSSQIQSYIGNKLDQWASARGSTVDHLINSAGIGMTISGLLTIGTAAAQGINDFISWLIVDEGITNGGSVSVIDTPTNFSGVTVARIYQLKNYNVNGNLSYELVYVVSSGEVYAYRVGDTSTNDTYSTVVFVSSSDFVLLRVQYYNGQVQSTNTSTINKTDNNVYWYSASIQLSQNDLSAVPLINDGRTWIQILASLQAGAEQMGENLTVVGGAISIPQIQSTDKYFIDVAGVLPGDTVIDAADTIIDGVIAGTQTVIDGEVAEEEPEYVITGPVAVSGLDSVFPFCIPFDIYHMVSALAADPEAPSFTWRFYVPGLCDETIEIDLAPFNTVAQILRTVELLLFCVGLAFETRKLIRG